MPALIARQWFWPDVRTLQRIVACATEPPQPTWWKVWIGCVHHCCRRNPGADGVEGHVRATSEIEALSKARAWYGEEHRRRRCRSCRRPLALNRLQTYDTGDTEL